MTEPLDLIIAGTAPDEITKAAIDLINNLESRYEPWIEKSLTIHHEIDPDPTIRGIAHFNEKLSLLRADSNMVSMWLTALIAEKRKAQARVKAAKVAFDEKLQLRLANDPDVQDAVGQQAKLAVARASMAREARIVAYADRIYSQVLGYYEAVKLCYDNLADTKRDLMSQLAVIKQSIAIGEAQGGEFPIDRGGVSPPRTKQQELEARIAADIPASGTTSF